MVDIKVLLEKLNEEQIKPVLDTEGPVLVIAGAGSGKTRVLTTRIAYLILEKKVAPANILAITFTNKAAEEMKERLKKMVGNANEMWVSTIHSMCVKILRSHIDLLGLNKNFTIYDETDKDKVLKRVIEDLGYEDDGLLKLAKNLISSAKNECLYPEEFKREFLHVKNVEEIFNIYLKYQEALERSSALDFDDLLFRTYELFHKFPEVAKSLSSKFMYVHIDEFQDTNKVQFEICRALSQVHGNFFVVGDDDQSIYGWRGAKIENILSFDKMYSKAKVYKLQRNYRSTKSILTLANGIISKNKKRRQKELWTDNDAGNKVETYVGQDEMEEAAYVAMQIKGIIARNPNVEYKDFAVFMRLNALSRAFEQEFTKYGIPYAIFGGFRFFERKEIKDVLSYLKIVNNTQDDESFFRAVVCPKRGIGEKSLEELREFSISMGLSVYDGIDFIHQTTLSSSVKTKLINFKNLLQSFSEFAKEHTVFEVIRHILDATNFMAQFEEKTEENLSRTYNVSELINSAEQFCRDNFNVTLADYLNSVTLSSDTDAIDNDNSVAIATIHSAKGLEYPIVFVSGCDDGILPVSRSFFDDDEMEEERRLMYVAVTRAKKRLYLTRANSRYMYGRREYMSQSRFLKDVGDILFPRPKNTDGAYLSNQTSSNNNVSYSATTSGGYSSSYAKTFLNASRPTQQSNVSFNKFKSGIKVRHAKFGEGTVILVKGTDDNLIVDVAFKGVGIKSLAVKYAPLEIL